LVHKQLFEEHDFSIKLNATERSVWEALENVCGNFLSDEEARGLSNVKTIRIALNFKRKREKIFADQCHLDLFGSV
jgi:hypothetical protein